MKRLAVYILSILCLVTAVQTTYAAPRVRVRDPRAVIFDHESMLQKMYYGSSSSSSEPNLAAYALQNLSFRYPTKLWRTYVFKHDQYVALFPTEKDPTTQKIRESGVFIEWEPLIKEISSPADYDVIFKRDMTLEDSEDTIAQDWFLPSFALLKAEDTTLFNRPARKYSYTGERRSQSIKGEAIVMSIGKRLYRIDFQAPVQFYDADYATYQTVHRWMTLTDAASSKSASSARNSSSVSSIGQKKPLPRRIKASSASSSLRVR